MRHHHSQCIALVGEIARVSSTDVDERAASPHHALAEVLQPTRGIDAAACISRGRQPSLGRAVRAIDKPTRKQHQLRRTSPDRCTPVPCVAVPLLPRLRTARNERGSLFRLRHPGSSSPALAVHRPRRRADRYCQLLAHHAPRRPPTTRRAAWRRRVVGERWPWPTPTACRATVADRRPCPSISIGVDSGEPLV